MINPLYGPREQGSIPEKSDFQFTKTTVDRLSVTRLSDEFCACSLKWGTKTAFRNDQEWISLAKDIELYQDFDDAVKQVRRYDYVSDQWSGKIFDQYLEDPLDAKAQELSDIKDFDPLRVINLKSFQIPNRELPVARVVTAYFDESGFDLDKLVPHMEKHPWHVQTERSGTAVYFHVKPTQADFDGYNQDFAKIGKGLLNDFTLEETVIWPFRRDENNHAPWVPAGIDPTRTDPFGLGKLLF